MNKIQKALVIRRMESGLRREARHLATESILAQEFSKGVYDAPLRTFVEEVLRKFEMSIRKSAKSLRGA